LIISQPGIFENFAKLLKKTQLPEKFKVLEKFELLDKRRLKIPEKSRKEMIPAPRTTSIYKLIMISMVWNISTGQLGLDAWLCSLPDPAHLFASLI